MDRSKRGQSDWPACCLDEMLRWSDRMRFLSASPSGQPAQPAWCLLLLTMIFLPLRCAAVANTGKQNRWRFIPEPVSPHSRYRLVGICGPSQGVAQVRPYTTFFSLFLLAAPTPSTHTHTTTPTHTQNTSTTPSSSCSRFHPTAVEPLRPSNAPANTRQKWLHTQLPC
ncbi:hypothetical protein EJ05DRAFT_395616 [Pseudovirgaria hyperparasitica]|uniref:Uncharacterized protein n=1 Tax=Pseudovirgaria hyperparasitica TaxID=470096 RepID=A0A6A6W625_9PEZI|nr:uncharacterized protein EJ05DRAFT_395616 [Pseudovirgaria hyperparasitica]KAF2757629.1 hypothetical protein EJ05DRAFT_395616 [Pseudovirgaria hyperparasitica]